VACGDPSVVSFADYSQRSASVSAARKRRAQQPTEANRKASLLRPHLLLAKFSDTDSDFILFTDEKVFHVPSPVNTQNNCVYIPRNAKKHEVAAEQPLSCRRMRYFSMQFKRRHVMITETT